MWEYLLFLFLSRRMLRRRFGSFNRTNIEPPVHSPPQKDLNLQDTLTNTVYTPYNPP